MPWDHCDSAPFSPWRWWWNVFLAPRGQMVRWVKVGSGTPQSWRDGWWMMIMSCCFLPKTSGIKYVLNLSNLKPHGLPWFRIMFPTQVAFEGPFPHSWHKVQVPDEGPVRPDTWGDWGGPSFHGVPSDVPWPSPEAEKKDVEIAPKISNEGPFFGDMFFIVFPFLLFFVDRNLAAFRFFAFLLFASAFLLLGFSV